MAYFEENSEAMVALESMVDAVGIRNVIFALASICNGKAEHVAVNWQDTKTGKVWAKWSGRFHALASQNIADPLEP